MKIILDLVEMTISRTFDMKTVYKIWLTYILVMSEHRNVFKKGKTFVRYAILKLVGQGGFSDIYEVQDERTYQKFALKVEPKSQKERLPQEIEVIRSIQPSPFFPLFYDSSSDLSKPLDNYNYYAMDLLGPNLTILRKKIPDSHFTLNSTVLLAIHMLRCIEEFHMKGYIHRDIKPANFLVKQNRKYPLALIDYGLARKHLVKNPHQAVTNYYSKQKGDNYIPLMVPQSERKRVGFVGTSRYASIASHEYRDLGRKDDLISWFFSVVELYHGSLPWSNEKDKNAILKLKKQYCTVINLNNEIHPFEPPPPPNQTEGNQFEPDNNDHNNGNNPQGVAPNFDPSVLRMKLCYEYNMPVEFTSIWRILMQYDYSSEPDYALILSFLVHIVNTKDNHITFKDTLDYEYLDEQECKTISLVPFIPSPFDNDAYIPEKKLLKKCVVPVDEAYQSGGCCLLI